MTKKKCYMCNRLIDSKVNWIYSFKLCDGCYIKLNTILEYYEDEFNKKFIKIPKNP